MKEQSNDTFNDFKFIPGRKFVFLNVRSLLPNINLLRYELSDSSMFLIGIWETWLTKRIHDGLVEIDGYNIVRHDRERGKRGGGLIFYIHNTINFERVSDDLNSSNSDLEMLTILVKPEHQRNFLVSLVYIPPSANKPLAIEGIKALSLPTNDTPPLRLIAGDFNMEYLVTTKRTTESALLRNLERALGLTQMVKKATAVT